MCKCLCLCKDVSLCKDPRGGLGRSGASLRSGHTHPGVDRGHAQGKVYVCVCEAWAKGSGGSVGVEGMRELMLVSAYV